MNKNTTASVQSIMVTPPTNFTEAYFTINGLIHDLKTYFAATERSSKATEIIRRECTKLSAKGSIVGRASFRNIVQDYGFVVFYNDGTNRGTIIGDTGMIEFALI